MSPSPTLALVLLGAWVLVLFAATNAAAFNQWRAADDADTTGYYSPSGSGSAGHDPMASERNERPDWVTSERRAPTSDD